MVAYVVVEVEVSDPARYAEYARFGTDVMAKYGGRFLARGAGAETLEGAPPAPSRAVIVEFDHRAAAKRWYDSPEYAKAREMRAGAATWRAWVMDGMV